MSWLNSALARACILVCFPDSIFSCVACTFLSMDEMKVLDKSQAVSSIDPAETIGIGLGLAFCQGDKARTFASWPTVASCLGICRCHLDAHIVCSIGTVANCCTDGLWFDSCSLEYSCYGCQKYSKHRVGNVFSESRRAFSGTVIVAIHYGIVYPDH